MVYIFEVYDRALRTTREVRVPAHSTNEAWWHVGRQLRYDEEAKLIRATARATAADPPMPPPHWSTR